MSVHMFKLECLTDLHVGNGETTYGIIDNEVEKDTVLTDVPIIHASGVKGALREHFERLWDENDKLVIKAFCNREEMVKGIFGDKDNPGGYKFLNAGLIARPLRVSDGSKPYILTTSEDILQNFSSLMSGLGLSGFYSYEPLNFVDDKMFLCNVKTIREIEGKGVGIFNPSDYRMSGIQKLIGNDFAIAKTLSDFDLPTRARNALKDGKSENIWYEELVPHKSIFYFIVITPDSECKLCFEEGTPVQFGGNASIGNGFTRIEKVVL